MATWRTNDTRGREINISIEADSDDGPFLAMASLDMDGLELIITDPREAEYFFQEVERVKKDWERLTSREASR